MHVLWHGKNFTYTYFTIDVNCCSLRILLSFVINVIDRRSWEDGVLFTGLPALMLTDRFACLAKRAACLSVCLHGEGLNTSWFMAIGDAGWCAFYLICNSCRMRSRYEFHLVRDILTELCACLFQAWLCVIDNRGKCRVVRNISV